MPVDADLTHESRLFADGARLVAGVDEVGRGALAGPLVVGAVTVTPQTVPLPGLRDSKLVSAPRRQLLHAQIPSWSAGWALGTVEPAEVDELGMAAALRVAVSRALAGLPVRPDAVIVDGPVNLAGGGFERVLAMKKADQLCASVAAASVMAKVHRDAVMVDLDAVLPGYGFGGHKGYGAAAHYAALADLGPSATHRRSFRLDPRS